MPRWDGMLFNPTNGYTGSASISLQKEDLGNTGSGGNLSDTDVVAIQVGGVRFKKAIAGTRARKTLMYPVQRLQHPMGTATSGLG